MSEKAGEIYYDIEADVSGLLKAQGKANKSLDSIGNSATTAAKKIDELQTNINRVAGAIAASLVVDWGKAFLVAADNMSQLNARIERLTGSAATASETIQSLMRISSSTGGSLQDTAKLWETLSTALRDTGATNGQIIQLTETLQKIGRIGGSSSEEMANALRQFGQSISSGTIRAEEFNSILEQMPELARQIAAGMGVSIGELRQLMLDGKLTAEDALNAIQKQTGSVNAEFEKLPRTLSQANTALTNSFLSMIDSVNQATGASSGMVAVIDSLTAALDRLAGKAISADAQISDLNSTAEMFTRRARTWSWLGLDGWEAQNKALAGLSNKAAMLVGDLAAVSKASQTAANTKPIEIKTTVSATGSKAKGGKSAAQKEAEQYAKAQDSINEKLEALRQESILAAGSTSELTREQQLLRAEMSLGADATDEQRQKAREYKAQALDTAEALKKQAQAERDKQAAQSNFSSLQSQASPVASVESQFQQQIEQLNQYAALYPQKIAEVEAVRASIEEQYRQKRLDAQWQELSQMNIGFGMLTSAVDAFGGNASNVITGLITGTMSAQDAMRSLGNTMLNSVVNALVQVGVEALKNFIIGQTLGAASTAASVGMATTTAAAWAPAAALASLASFGANSAPAMAGIASTVGLAQGLALAGARYNGGPVSAGSMYQVGERGKPEIYQASTGKQYMIPGDNGRVISNKDMQSGSGIQVSVIFNDMSSGQHMYDARATQTGNTLTVEAFVADMNNGGVMSQAIIGNTTAKRTPRGQG
ncbi:TPA: tape measure protein [Enterobacter chengduensis]|uniref:tape measure protein n=1 Tax=Enterobacter cloacae complex TaxID=354276 RepID=UPI000649BE52|nr:MULTISPECIES: tape measure protein [Enterobacter cloacae complex]EKX4008485.1 tape measure protein [Enterobacter cloacae]KLQ12327.1 phage tail length tape measure protein [Enterobacter chengduensis]KZP86786.1 phage tail tape measure protein [Enterobacter chengduensis]CZZ51272.1 phage tape measure protein [Enterobacter cloacae]